MLDIGGWEFLVVAFVLLMVVGPKELPKMLRGFTRAMRQILVDHYRSWKSARRGGGMHPLPLQEADRMVQWMAGVDGPFKDLDLLDRALNALESQEIHKRKVTMVELRFFVGLTQQETAEVLDVSRATVIRDWEFTRAWLYREMEKMEQKGHGSGRED